MVRNSYFGPCSYVVKAHPLSPFDLVHYYHHVNLNHVHTHHHIYHKPLVCAAKDLPAYLTSPTPSYIPHLKVFNAFQSPS